MAIPKSYDQKIKQIKDIYRDHPTAYLASTIEEEVETDRGVFVLDMFYMDKPMISFIDKSQTFYKIRPDDENKSLFTLNYISVKNLRITYYKLSTKQALQIIYENQTMATRRNKKMEEQQQDGDSRGSNRNREVVYTTISLN